MNDSNPVNGRRSLQDSEERFRNVFLAANDAMVLSDADGVVLDANDAYFNLYGFSAEEVIGEKFYIIFPEETHQEVMDTTQRVQKEFTALVLGVIARLQS